MSFGYLMFILAGIFVVLVLAEIIGALLDNRRCMPKHKEHR